MATSPLLVAAISFAWAVPYGLLLRSDSERRVRGPMRLFMSLPVDLAAKLLLGALGAATMLAPIWVMGEVPSRSFDMRWWGAWTLAGAGFGKTLRWLRWRWGARFG